MKILIICHYFKPHIGGIEIVAYNQAKELVRLGNKVTVLTSKTNNEKETEILDGIRIIRTNALNILETKLGIPYPLISPAFINVLKKEIEGSDLMHTHGHIYTTSFLASYVAKKLNKPIILTQHSTYVFHKNPVLRILESIADKTIGKYTLNSANLVVAVSERTKEYANSIIHNNKKITVLYNGVDLKRFKPFVNKLNVKKELGIKNKFVCFCIRRITFKNGIENLIKTAEYMANKKNIVFLLGGEGPGSDKVKFYIKKNKLSNFKLLGRISDSDLPKYYSVSDLFILPSQAGEGFPLVVLEAFSSGVPVIATKSGGHTEIIKNGITGYLTDINKPVQIAQKIEHLCRESKELKDMSSNCRAIIQEKFSWKSNVSQLISLYKKTYQYEIKE
jgi:glycosyltransferase involved in cell wall biosynthesis